MSAGAAPFVPSYISSKEQHNETTKDKTTTSKNKYPQFHDNNDLLHRSKSQDYDSNYYSNMPNLIQANCTRITSPRIPGRNDNIALGDQYLSSNYHPFIPIPYQYSQNYISDNRISNQRGYYPSYRNYDRRKTNKMQSHHHPSHDLEDDSIKNDTKDNNTNHPTQEINQAKTDTNTEDNIKSRQHKNNTSAVEGSTNIVKGTKKSRKKKNKKSSTPNADKDVSTTSIELSQGKNLQFYS